MSLAPVRLLVIDENKADVLQIRETLEKHEPPFEVHSAANSRDALWSLKNNVFDVAAISTHLKEGDALVLLRRLRDEGYDLPAIFLGDVDHVSAAVRALTGGAADFLSKKQIEGPMLAARLLRAVETYRLRAELAQQRTRLMEEQARHQVNRLKSEFLANTSHELRTPLSAILGYSEILKDELEGDIDPELYDFLRRLRENASHLLDLVNSMLDYAAMITGDAPVKNANFQLGDALERVVSICRTRAKKKAVNIQWEVTPATLTLESDAIRVQQLVFNLLDNAIKFSKPEPPGDTPTRASCDVGLRAWAEGDKVFIEIRDRGIGISPEDLARIFDAFEQVDGSPARKHGGLGLGLSVARGMAESMGGSIEAESTPGAGSRFLVRLPLKPAAS